MKLRSIFLISLIAQVSIVAAARNLRGRDWSDTFYQQRPIFPYEPYEAKANLLNEEYCSNSDECASGCCLLDLEQRARICRPKGTLNSKCSVGQIKGGYYADACPCEDPKSGASSDLELICSYPGYTCERRKTSDVKNTGFLFKRHRVPFKSATTSKNIYTHG